MRTVIFDIDGTLADLSHRRHHIERHPKNYDKFFDLVDGDTPVLDIIELNDLIARNDYIILLVSGRPERTRVATEEWMVRQGVQYDELYMRPDGDYRPDTEIKSQILDHLLAEGHDIAFVVDDRPSVVAMWRERGITCLQCREWDEVTPPAKGLLTIMVGPSGAGKSHWLSTKGGSLYGIHKSHIVESDQIRHDLCGNMQDQSKNDEVFKALHAIVKTRISQGLPAVVDATNLRNKDRLAVARLADGGPVRYIVVNRPMDEKYRDGGWRTTLGFDLIAKHEQTFKSNLKDILMGDGLPNVIVSDMRARVMKHPAVMMPFEELHIGLNAAWKEGLVRMTAMNGLELYCYTERCTFEREWNQFTLLARGIILYPEAKRIAALPFPKFFNVGERAESIPNLPFETFEKLDGSLIILFYHLGEWRTATKGSLNSDQAQWAKKKLKDYDISKLDIRTTYLCEGIYRENKIVIAYPYEGLSLLGAYHEDGRELSYSELEQASVAAGLRLAKRFAYENVSDLLLLADNLPVSEEGFVLRFSNGLRLKIKGAEYRRIHALISNLTPLAMWQAMLAGSDLEAVKKDLPEEFWQDFDSIVNVLTRKANAIVNSVAVVYKDVKDWSDKELGLNLHTLPEDVRDFMFTYRRNNGNLMEGKAREKLFKVIRPTGNVLPGYVPSYAINKVLEEVG